MRFINRSDAGRKLAKALIKYRNADAIVYALPRGGVVLGYEIAKKLDLPLDLVITRKIGHPLQKEYAVCAVAEDGDMFCDEFERTFLNKNWLRAEAEKEQREATRRRESYLEGKKPLSPKGKTAIIVDDGIATGLTMLLAIYEVRHGNPSRIVVAVPVMPSDVAKKIRQKADELIALDIPELYLGAVGAYYDEFPQIEDEQVKKLLRGKP